MVRRNPEYPYRNDVVSHMEFLFDHDFADMQVRIALHIQQAPFCPQVLHHRAGRGLDAAGVHAVGNPYADVDILHRLVFVTTQS